MDAAVAPSAVQASHSPALAGLFFVAGAGFTVGQNIAVAPFCLTAPVLAMPSADGITAPDFESRPSYKPAYEKSPEVGDFSYVVAGAGFEPATFRFFRFAPITRSVGLSHHPSRMGEDAPIIVSEPLHSSMRNGFGCGLPSVRPVGFPVPTIIVGISTGKHAVSGQFRKFSIHITV